MTMHEMIHVIDRYRLVQAHTTHRLSDLNAIKIGKTEIRSEKWKEINII